MEERLLGEYTTYETRSESFEKVDKQKRYSQIIECDDEKSLASYDLFVNAWMPLPERMEKK